MALVDRKRGRPAGHRALDSQREDMIEKAIRKYYLKPTRPSVSQLIRDIQTDCTVAGLKPPHRRTIETRLNDLDLRQRALRRGEKWLEKKAKAVPGKLRASKSLDIVQIDHTKADIFVVDEETREPIGRPWLTLAMDVFSRMVTGFYLTMEAPSRLSTSLCLLHSVYDKTAWLKERDIEEPWPVAGVVSQSLLLGSLILFVATIIQRVLQIIGIQIGWFYRTDACGPCARSQHPAALLKPSGTI